MKTTSRPSFSIRMFVLCYEFTIFAFPSDSLMDSSIVPCKTSRAVGFIVAQGTVKCKVVWINRNITNICTPWKNFFIFNSRTYNSFRTSEVTPLGSFVLSLSPITFTPRFGPAIKGVWLLSPEGVLTPWSPLACPHLLGDLLLA